jgi:uncharacterized membrane protein YedE/YeeE
MNFGEWLLQPWPWYIAGPLIGLMVPVLLLAGNKSFGVSSSFRHICAACFPAGIPYFKYEWKKEAWNLFFAAGIIAGSFIATNYLSENPRIAPPELFNWSTLLSAKGIILFVGGGFLVGFGTRYAGGCTSGHSIMGLSNLQVPSLIATICFMIGGFTVANLVLPYILQL